MPTGITVGYKNSNGEDIGEKLVPKDYLLDRYPELADTFRFAGLWLWGQNTYGQLGDGNTVTNRSSPIQTIAGGSNWKDISGGLDFSMAIETDGTLWLWGRNNYGQLGTNDITSYSSPVQTVSGGTNWKQVSGGTGFAAAIKTDGTLWTWGRNDFGQLGDNTVTHRSSPIQTVSGGTNWKQVSGGGNFAAAIKTDGTLWLWGFNTDGGLGDNTSGSSSRKSSPVQTIAGGTNWKQVSCGSTYAFTAAIKTDGTLWLWGNNLYGQLGDNTVTRKSSPVQTVSGGTNWKQVSCAGRHTAAIKTDGTLWLWGQNIFGTLGTNNQVKTSSPVQTISGGTNWKQIGCSNDSTAAIKTDGTLWTWGYNNHGQLGDNTTNNKSSPIQTVSGGTNWKQIQKITGNSLLAIRDNSNDYI